MWYYRRRLRVHPVEMTVTFAGQRLQVAADGCILTPVDEDLDLKMRRAPHIFIFKAGAAQPEKVDNTSTKDDNVKPRRARKRRKVSEG